MVWKFQLIVKHSPVKDLIVYENLTSVCPLPPNFETNWVLVFTEYYSNVNVNCGLYKTEKKYTHKGVIFCFLLFHLDIFFAKKPLLQV